MRWIAVRIDVRTLLRSQLIKSVAAVQGAKMRHPRILDLTWRPQAA
jgi:hypothetical protein